MLSDPSLHEQGDIKRAAAIAFSTGMKRNNGGLNSFPDFTFDRDALEVKMHLRAVGSLRLRSA